MSTIVSVDDALGSDYARFNRMQRKGMRKEHEVRSENEPPYVTDEIPCVVTRGVLPTLFSEKPRDGISTLSLSVDQGIAIFRDPESKEPRIRAVHGIDPESQTVHCVGQYTGKVRPGEKTYALKLLQHCDI